MRSMAMQAVAARRLSDYLFPADVSWRTTRGTVVPYGGGAVNPMRYGSVARTGAGTMVVRRRRTGRRGYTRTGGSYRRTVANINALPIALNNQDVSINLPATGTLQLSSTPATGGVLVGIIQGVSALSSRIGRYIALRGLEISAEITFVPGAGTTPSDVFHLYIILDTQANGAYPIATDMWSVTTAGYQIRNLDNAQRFRTLRHYVVNLASTAGVSGAYGSKTVNFERYIKLPNILVDYAANTGVIGEIKANNLIMGYGSSNGLCSLVGTARVRYHSK